jgi:hypothetical protein
MKVGCTGASVGNFAFSSQASRAQVAIEIGRKFRTPKGPLDRKDVRGL